MDKGRLTRWLSHRIYVYEALLCLLFLVAIFFGRLTSPPARDPSITDQELTAFSERYGPSRQTEHGEEWMIRDFFGDRRGGFFVDIGANDYKSLSKTWYLETQLGWSGIAVDALKEFEQGFVQHRPRTKFFTFFVSDRSDESARLFVISRNTTVSSGDRAFVEQFGTPDRVDVVPTITLNDLLSSQRVERIDFLSMDIELHEPEALRGFDIQRYEPQLVCIEALLPVRQQILDYFARNGYIIDGRYLRADRENLYFRPRSGSSTP
jgi:FkbM family methyltransferase